MRQPVFAEVERVRRADNDEGGEDAKVRKLTREPDLFQSKVTLSLLVMHIDAGVHPVIRANDLGAKHLSIDGVALQVLDAHLVRVVAVVGGGASVLGGDVAESRTSFIFPTQG